jgi:SHAQKYF class myb-like DNA-binding protein
MNKNSSNIPTYNSTESTFLNKETEKKELLEKTDPKKEKPLLFNTINYSLFENLIKKNMNEGRWSQNEHIKFLRAYVNFGKKYKLSQKYIGSRNSTQIRAHAQKFFRKLKTLKNDQFDFTVDSIKSLSDIFELIKASNKTNLDNKEYLVNTLIDISKMTIKKGEIILDEKNELNSFKKDIKIIIKKKEGEIAFNNSLLDEENLKKEIIDEIGNNNFDNEKESNIFEDEEINNDNDIMTLDNNLNENVNIGLKELNIDNIYEQNDKIINRKSDLSVKEQNDISKYANLNNINSNFNFDNSYVVLSGDSDIFYQNEIPSEEKNFLIVKKNYQSPYLKFICNYFS